MDEVTRTILNIAGFLFLVEMFLLLVVFVLAGISASRQSLRSLAIVVFKYRLARDNHCRKMFSTMQFMKRRMDDEGIRYTDMDYDEFSRLYRPHNAAKQQEASE